MTPEDASTSATGDSLAKRTSSGTLVVAPAVASGEAVTLGQMDALSSTYATVAAVDSGADVVCWGDSLTAGGWPNTLDAGLTVGTVRNAGVGGENARTIAARQGGLPMLLLPTGGSIPASGGVTVTIAADPWQTSTLAPLVGGDGIPDGNFVGSLAGVPGTLTYSGGVYTFTRTTPGSVVPVTRPQPFYTDWSEARRADVTIIWAGRNDCSDLEGTLRSIRAMVSHLSPARPRFLVLGVTKGRTEYTGSSTYGGTTAGQIDAINTALAREYGRRFIDVNGYLVAYGLADAGITATSSDTLDIASGAVPSSLRIDLIHMTAAGYTLVGNLVGARMAELGWGTYAAQSYPAPPPAIANVVPNGQAEVSADGYVSQNSAVVGRTTSEAYAGAASISVAATTHVDSRVLIFSSGTTRFAVTAGLTYRLRCRIKTDAGKALKPIITAYDAVSGGASVGASTLATTVAGTTWTEMYAEWVAPAGAQGAVIAIAKASPNTADAFTWYVDAVEFGLPA